MGPHTRHMLGSVMVHAVFIMLPAVGLPLPDLMSLHTLQGSITFLLFYLSASYTAVMTTPASTGLTLTDTCLSLAQSPHLQCIPLRSAYHNGHNDLAAQHLLNEPITSEHTVLIARNGTHQCQQLAPRHHGTIIRWHAPATHVTMN